MSTGGTAAQRGALRDAAFACAPTAVEETAIWRYQQHDGTHDDLNTLLRGRPARPSEVRRLRPVFRGLDSVLSRAELPVDLVVYRGLRDSDGLAPPTRPLPFTVPDSGFVSTSLDRRIAIREFMGRGPSAALLEVTAPAGAPALWLPPIGDPEYAYESEVLFRRGTFLTFRDRRVDGRRVVFSCEVVW